MYNSSTITHFFAALSYIIFPFIFFFFLLFWICGIVACVCFLFVFVCSLSLSPNISLENAALFYIFFVSPSLSVCFCLLCCFSTQFLCLLSAVHSVCSASQYSKWSDSNYAVYLCVYKRRARACAPDCMGCVCMGYNKIVRSNQIFLQLAVVCIWLAVSWDDETAKMKMFVLFLSISLSLSLYRSFICQALFLSLSVFIF